MKVSVFASFLAIFPATSYGQSLSLSQLLDDSVGYVNVSPGVILIEGETLNSVCQVDVGAEFFEAYRQGDLDAAKNASEVTCVPLAAFVE